MARSSSRSRGRPSAPARSAPPPARAPAPKAAPAPAPAPAAAQRTPPPPAAPAPAPAPMMQAAPQQGGMLSGLGGTLAQGFAFGAGSAMARRAVDSVFGGSDSAPAPAPEVAAPAAPVPTPAPSMSADACKWDLKAYNDCMKDNNFSVASCEFYFNALKQCQESSM